jgi:hypothetical protein
MTTRHNLVLEVLYRFCSLMHATVRAEPAGLDHTSDKRPDIEVCLDDCVLLGDVTITHPTTKTSRRLAARKGIEAVGDLSEARKIGKYAEIAANIDREFVPIVLYTYGGFHRSAISFINKLTDSLDTATCLVSRADFKQQVKKHIAIAVQRGNADIMIQDMHRQQHIQWGKPMRRSPVRSTAAQLVGLVEANLSTSTPPLHDNNIAMSGSDSNNEHIDSEDTEEDRSEETHVGIVERELAQPIMQNIVQSFQLSLNRALSKLALGPAAISA